MSGPTHCGPSSRVGSLQFWPSISAEACPPCSILNAAPKVDRVSRAVQGCSTARGPSAGGRLMENSLRSPPPSYNALDSLTNPVHQCNLNHSTGVNINPRLNGKANRSNPRMLPAVGTSDVTLESAPEGNSFHTFNPSDSSSQVHRGSHLQKSDLFPKSRSHCDHPICSWWRWRGNEEKVY